MTVHWRPRGQRADRGKHKSFGFAQDGRFRFQELAYTRNPEDPELQALSPISRATMRVSNCENEDDVSRRLIHDVKRKLVEQEAPATFHIHAPTAGRPANLFDSMAELCFKTIRRAETTFSVPTHRGQIFSSCFSMEFNACSCH